MDPQASRLTEFWPNDIDESILREAHSRISSEFPAIGMKAIIADFDIQFQAIQEVTKRRTGLLL